MNKLDVIVTGLLNRNPDATLWDLLKVWYEELHGSFPVNETDDDVKNIVKMHLSGYSPSVISKVLELNQTNVVTYLRSMDFRPWIHGPACTIDTSALYRAVVIDGRYLGDVCGEFNVSKHIGNKIVEEFGTAMEYVNYAY